MPSAVEGRVGTWPTHAASFILLLAVKSERRTYVRYAQFSTKPHAELKPRVFVYQTNHLPSSDDLPNPPDIYPSCQIEEKKGYQKPPHHTTKKPDPDHPIPSHPHSPPSQFSSFQPSPSTHQPPSAKQQYQPEYPSAHLPLPLSLPLLPPRQANSPNCPPSLRKLTQAVRFDYSSACHYCLRRWRAVCCVDSAGAGEVRRSYC